MITAMLMRALGRQAGWFLMLLAVIAVAVPVMHLALPVDNPLHLSGYAVALMGKYLCFALLALSVDLIWGYCGILSLGHGAFFALGGYAMGMYLMRQIGTRGVYAKPEMPEFKVLLNWQQQTWYSSAFDHFIFAGFMVLPGPWVLAYPFGWIAFR